MKNNAATRDPIWVSLLPSIDKNFFKEVTFYQSYEISVALKGRISISLNLNPPCAVWFVIASECLCIAVTYTWINSQHLRLKHNYFFSCRMQDVICRLSKVSLVGDDILMIQDKELNKELNIWNVLSTMRSILCLQKKSTSHQQHKAIL